MSEGKTLILKKNSTQNRFDKKMVNKSSEGFLLTTRFYRSVNDASRMDPNKQKPKGKADIQLEGTVVKNKNQEKSNKLQCGKLMLTSSTKDSAITEKKDTRDHKEPTLQHYGGARCL